MAALEMEARTRRLSNRASRFSDAALEVEALIHFVSSRESRSSDITVRLCSIVWEAFSITFRI